MAQTVKHLSTMWETWVRSLGQEDSLEKEMATHSSILAWKTPWKRTPVSAVLPPGDLSNPGIEPRSPALYTDALPSEPPRKSLKSR